MGREQRTYLPLDYRGMTPYNGLQSCGCPFWWGDGCPPRTYDVCEGFLFAGEGAPWTVVREPGHVTCRNRCTCGLIRVCAYPAGAFILLREHHVEG